MDIRGVDMGNPIWAMHSAKEMAAVSDHEDAVKVFTEFCHLSKHWSVHVTKMTLLQEKILKL